MKRRGFLGMLFGAPAAVVAGKAAAEMPAFAKELLESEPEPAEASFALSSKAGWSNLATCIAPSYYGPFGEQDYPLHQNFAPKKRA